MKILHIIDGDYLSLNKRSVWDLIAAFKEANTDQSAILIGAGDLPIKFTNLIPKAMIKNRIKLWSHLKIAKPDIVIRYGAAARKIPLHEGAFMELIFAGSDENFNLLDKTSTVIVSSEAALNNARASGFSGSKSFMIPQFFINRGTQISKRELFIPEKERAVFIGGRFAKDMGYESLLDAISPTKDIYFLIHGLGDQNYIMDKASLANVKSRSRFVQDISSTSSLLSISEFALLPFNDPELGKLIIAAGKAGKLVVALKNSLAEEFIEDGKNGILLPPDDLYVIKKKIQEIVKTPQVAFSAMIEENRRHSARFQAFRSVSSTLAEFENLIQKFNERKNLLK